MAETLFRLFNLIVEKTVSEKLMIEAVYAGLAVGALKQIEARDKGLSTVRKISADCPAKPPPPTSP